MKTKIEIHEIRNTAKEVLTHSSIVKEIKEALDNLPEPDLGIVHREITNLRKQVNHLHQEGAIELTGQLAMFLLERGL